MQSTLWNWLDNLTLRVSVSHPPLCLKKTTKRTSQRIHYKSLRIYKSWSSHIYTLIKKAQKLLYFLRKLDKFPCQALVNFCSWATESILTGSFTNWTKIGRLCSWLIKTTQIIGTQLPSISDIGEVSAQSPKELKDNTHPITNLFTLLPTGKRYRSICCHTIRLHSNFSLRLWHFLNSPSTFNPKVPQGTTLWI